MKGKVEFLTDRCKGCNLCVLVCPTNIIYLSKEDINTKGYPVAKVEEMDKCIGCSSCALMCPDNVITVYKAEREKRK